MENFVKIVLIFCFAFLISGISAAGQKKTHMVFFEEEENELHVYRISGSEPGKTLLIVGGIQGDEPGGVLAADFYVDFSLKKGNLIVVPRANFPSILRNERKVNQDMNRKFADDNVSNYEADVVRVLKQLICESDLFLNLHEGEGIYSYKWESQVRNSRKYGQSVIADASFLESNGKGERIDLEAMAEKVIKNINRHIKDERYHFNFNNHRTGYRDSMHKEQRRSATYYAMNVCRIPAFSVESAKSLPLEQKIIQHIHAVNGFMDLLGIVSQNPGIDLKKPEMRYIIISVNDSIPVVVSRMQRLNIKRGDNIRVLDIVANYERGLSVDVIGVGNRWNDMKKRLVINEPTRIEVKKDSYSCGSVFLDFDYRGSKEVTGLAFSKTEPGHDSEIKGKLKINGQTFIVDNYRRVELKRGDRLVIEDIISGGIDPSRYIVNFKGFIGNRQNNDGEDRGYVIDISDEVLMDRYSLKKKGRHYYILITLDSKEVGKIFIDIKS